MIPCPACEAQCPDEALECSECHTLLWRDRLKTLYHDSRAAEAACDWTRCLQLLSECAGLLPPSSRQYRQVQAEIARVSSIYNQQPPRFDDNSLNAPDTVLSDGTWSGALRGAAFVTLHGLARPATLISLTISIAALAWLTDLPLAIGLMLMIYVHEIGHLILIQYYGYRFTWPVFIPLLGAFVLQGRPARHRAQAISIALAGPLAGAGVSFLLYLAAFAQPLPPTVRLLAHINLMLNFFNLLPVWKLDGGHIAAALRPRECWILAVAAGLVALAHLNWYAFLMMLAWLVIALDRRHARVKSDAINDLASRKLVFVLAGLLALAAVLLKTCSPR